MLTVSITAAALGVAEWSFRAFLPKLSRNTRILSEHKERAHRIRSFKNGPTMLILGNSTSGAAIDEKSLAKTLRQRGLSILIEHQPADSSGMREWFFQLKNMYIKQGAVPEWIMLAVGIAKPFTRQGEIIEDLYFSMLTYEDLPSFLYDATLKGFEERTDALFCFASALYGFRGTIQKRVLMYLTPSYENLRLAMRYRGPPIGLAPSIYTNTSWFSKFRDLTLKHGIQVVVLALPTEDIAGRLAGNERNLSANEGWDVLEPSAGAYWTKEEIPDGMHLSDAARTRFTKLLAYEIANLLKQREPNRGPWVR